jgi:RNA polymerase-binding transcription factor DksA
VAKTTGKKPSAHGKPARSAGVTKANHKTKPDLAVKTAAKSAKAPAKAPVKTVTKTVSKSVSKIADRKVAKPVTKPVAKAGPLPLRAIASGKPAMAAKASKPAKNLDTPGSNGARNGDRSLAQRAIRPPVPMPVPLAHSANGRARKNLAGLNARELDHFRDLLLAKRRELIGDMSSMEREALRSGGGSNLSNLPIHMADMGTDNYEQEFTLGLVQKERDLLKEINLALAKIQNGNYGLCEGTSLPIIKERLEYQPWARYSVEYQRKLERHLR